MTTPTEPGTRPGKPVDHPASVRRETRTQALILCGAAGLVVLLLLGAAVAGAWRLWR